MTREEAIKILEYPVKKWSMEWDEREDGLSYYEALDMAISALRQQDHPNAPLTGWVSVKERLPEADVAVLARCFYNESWRTLVCHTSKRDAGEWYTNVAGQWVQVTNWMPLPEPPEEGTV